MVDFVSGEGGRGGGEEGRIQKCISGINRDLLVNQLHHELY